MRDHAKKLAFILVLCAHAAALLLVERSLKQQHAAHPANDVPPLQVSFLTLTPPRAPRSGPSPARRRPEPPALTPPEPPDAAPPPESSTAITDFRAQGADAATNVAAGAGRPQPFGHEFAPAPKRPETGIYGPKNEHPAGTVEEVEGAERHWVTDDCYYDFERLPAPKEMPGPKTMSLHCKAPATGGTDMFRQQRPGYLTAPPQAAPPRP